MNQPIRCPRCSFPNVQSNQFCAQCGAQLSATQAGALPTKKSSTPSWLIALIVVGGVFAMCGLCAVLGSLSDKPKPPTESTVTSSKAAATTSPTPLPTPQWTSAEHLAKAKDMFDNGKGAESKEDLTIILGHLKAIPDDASEAKQARPLQKKVEAKLSKVVADEELLGPKPENSEWDSSVRCVDQYLKQTLNDYDSAEYMEWSPVVRMDTKEGPYWVVRLKLRATNAFGGKIIKEVIFFIRQNQIVKHSDL